ncbi:glycoside hydrolase family 30 protein [Mucilaginibacter yixingensis]|nr:glycoside hydrolase family 30 protein [Mucilaginibacter yixingensis]
MIKKFSCYAVATGILAFTQLVQAQTTAPKIAEVYTTAKSTDYKLSPTGTLTFVDKPQPLETDISVFIDPGKTFQSMVGIGGALTDAAAETYYKLPKDKQQEFMRAYYDPTAGIGYTLGRTNIQSCDFSSDSYAYVQPGDGSLKTFSIAHDLKYRVPFIKDAIKAAGGKLTMFASPWSPPAFMKTNNDVLHGGKLKPEYMQSWANLFIKFIKAYQQQGIPLWAITVQNEPMATQKWESCVFTAEEERDFVKKYMGPTFAKAKMNTKIIAWDHNRDEVYQQASVILSDPEAAKYIWGIGYHWYETWTGSSMRFDNVKLVNAAFPNKNLIFTEGCIERFDLNRVDDWNLGEKYGYSMINDFNSGATGWTDWNVLLDEQGGPNHVGNYCFAPIIGNTKTGQLIYTNEYYYLGHFSKFVRPGAKRVAASVSRDKLLSTAFKNANGQLVVVVMNNSDDKVPYLLWMKGKAAQATALPHSIATMIVK